MLANSQENTLYKCKKKDSLSAIPHRRKLFILMTTELSSFQLSFLIFSQQLRSLVQTHALQYVQKVKISNHRHAGFNTPILPQDEKLMRGGWRQAKERKNNQRKNKNKKIKSFREFKQPDEQNTCVTIAVAVETYPSKFQKLAHSHTHEMQLPIAGQKPFFLARQRIRGTGMWELTAEHSKSNNDTVTR